jgi:hypothetical protein
MGWLIPVGIPGGINAGFDGIPVGSGIVRLGDSLAALDPGHYRLWRAAAAAPQVGQLIAWGAAQGISDAADRVRELQDAELLIGDGPGIAQRIGRLTLRLLGECLGNGADISPVFIMRGRNQTRLQVDAHLFEVLLHSDGVSPISVTCAALDASRSRPGRRPCIETLAEGLPVLVRNEVVLLGRRSGE